MSESMLSQCDPVLTQEDAEAPILSPMIPVKGLRRDLSGNLTNDSIMTILEGIKSLGVVIDSDSTKTAVLQESRNTLCKLNAQYVFLLKNLVSSIARSEEENVTKKLIDTLRQKNQETQDVLSVSRHVLEIDTGSTLKEGFLGKVMDPFMTYREAFQTAATQVANNAEMIRSGQYKVTQERSLAVSKEKNLYAERLTNMYGLLNVVSIGLLFYIMSTN